MKLNLVLLALAIGRAGAFQPSTPRSSSMRVSTEVGMGPPPADLILKETYGEGSRKYRRTRYTHDDWVKHRSPERFTKNLFSMVNSGVYKSLAREVTATTAFAAFLVVWNGLTGGYVDLSGVQHDAVLPNLPGLTLPLTPFTLLSPSLGLLLAFRTNKSYSRWDEARKFWGLNINHTRDLNRMATAWYGHGNIPVDPAVRAQHLEQVSLMTWAFVRSMKRHLSPPDEDEEDYIAEMKARLSPQQADKIINAAHRPNRALYDLSMAIDKLPMHFMRKVSDCPASRSLILRSVFNWRTVHPCESHK